jgi:hypothetical protein
VLTDDADLTAKGLADAPMTVGNVVRFVRHMSLLRTHYLSLEPEVLG